jgi:hypothetical protein
VFPLLLLLFFGQVRCHTIISICSAVSISATTLILYSRKTLAQLLNRLIHTTLIDFFSIDR